MFAGCGKTKYLNELLELVCGFEFEFSSQLQRIIKDNWLVNLTGIPGHWFAGNLLVEKTIRQLKVMSVRRTSTFGSQFFKTLGLNVCYFLSASDALRSAVGLSDISGFHPKKRRETALKTLELCYRERQPHYFRAKRAQGSVAADDFATGQQSLKNNNGERIRAFVERTTCDNGNYPSVNAEDEAGKDDDMMGREGSPRDGVLPNRVVDGMLVLGDDDEDNSEDD